MNLATDLLVDSPTDDSSSAAQAHGQLSWAQHIAVQSLKKMTPEYYRIIEALEAEEIRLMPSQTGKTVK